MVWGAGPPCRPGRPARCFLFEGPRPAPPARIHMAPEAPQPKKSGRAARPAWRAGPPYHMLYNISYIIYNILYIFHEILYFSYWKGGKWGGGGR